MSEPVSDLTVWRPARTVSRRRRVLALVLAGIAAAGIVGGATAQGWSGGPFNHGRWSALSPEDRAAFAEARIAALHAGLRLNAEQEKLWPPVETAMRDLSRLRRDQRQAMRDRPRLSEDAPAALRAMADATSARGEALRKLADASGPLYATLDPDQKRRAMMLTRPMGHRGWHGGPRRGWDEERGFRERGPRDE